MKSIIEASHIIDESYADVGNYPYSFGGKQVVYKDYEIDDFQKEQSIENQNEDGIEYITYVNEKNILFIVFIISKPEIDFFMSLKYLNDVYITLDDNVKYKLINTNVELSETGTLGLYEARMSIVTEDSYNIITGNEL